MTERQLIARRYEKYLHLAESYGIIVIIHSVLLFYFGWPNIVICIHSILSWLIFYLMCESVICKSIEDARESLYKLCNIYGYISVPFILYHSVLIYIKTRVSLSEGIYMNKYSWIISALLLIDVINNSIIYCIHKTLHKMNRQILSAT
jgi:hypothetical protein